MKPHIGIFGRRNNGKSSLINAITGQETAIVADYAGTTTDPVKKSMEIFGIGPVVLIDTAGIDDDGEVGSKRVEKSLDIIKSIDLAIIVTNNYQWGEAEELLCQRLQEFATPYLIVNSKSDLLTHTTTQLNGQPIYNISARTGEGLQELTAAMVKAMPPSAYMSHSILEGIIREGDTIVMVTPIDSEAPEGRLILPQVQLIRDALDNNAIAIVLKEDKLAGYLANHPTPALVITDSQMFGEVSAIVPESIPLTSFSILLAKHKGAFTEYLSGTPQIDNLRDGDHILVLESCTHQSSCEDIGRVKIPRWLQKHTGKQLQFTFVSGLQPLPDLHNFAMVIQCGGCMITQKQLINRLQPAIKQNIPITNYGMLIAYINGIFERAVAPLRAL